MLGNLVFLGMQKTRGKISMKSILLASTAIVAFAGAAAADGHTTITPTISATLGYNDREIDVGDNEVGFYWEGILEIDAVAELDNGITAGAFFSLTVAEDDDASANDGGVDVSSDDFVVSLSAANGALFFGQTGVATDRYWLEAGDMEADDFTSGPDSNVIRGDINVGPVRASVSYIVDDSFVDGGGEDDPIEQFGFGAEYDAGFALFTAGYQAEALDDELLDGGDFTPSEIYGLSAQGTFSSVTATLAYAEDTTNEIQSIGFEVAVPFGPVTTTAYYVEEITSGDADDAGFSDDPNFGVNVAYSEGPLGVTVDYANEQDLDVWAIDVSYDLGNGLTLFAGVENGNEEDEDYHVAAKYDLGGGADITFSYAEDDDGDQEEEIGADDYQEGATIELVIAF